MWQKQTKHDQLASRGVMVTSVTDGLSWWTHLLARQNTVATQGWADQARTTHRSYWPQNCRFYFLCFTRRLTCFPLHSHSAPNLHYLYHLCRMFQKLSLSHLPWRQEPSLSKVQGQTSQPWHVCGHVWSVIVCMQSWVRAHMCTYVMTMCAIAYMQMCVYMCDCPNGGRLF